MKYLRYFSLACIIVPAICSCSILTSIQWDPNQLASAVGNMTTAASITDAQIVELCRQSTAKLDKENTIETGAYNTRLQKLVKSVNVQGLNLNFKVYKTSEINAFASADGSVRVYSGLMDVMNDDELIAVIGHEIGHVSLEHVKKSIKSSYMTAASRDVVNAAGTVGVLSQTVLGDIAESLVGAQYSQKHEYEADEFGFNFAIQNGHSPYSMYNALNKLMQLSSGSQASAVSKMFSSHPDNEKRCQRMKSMAEKYSASKK